MPADNLTAAPGGPKVGILDNGWHWITSGKKGVAPTARAAMIAADLATKEPK